MVVAPGTAIALESAPPPAEDWRSWDPEKLATSYLDFNIGALTKLAQSAESSQSFHEKYQPSHAARPGNLEPGGMDAHDYDVAALADEQDEDSRDDDIERSAREAEDLWNQVGEYQYEKRVIVEKIPVDEDDSDEFATIPHRSISAYADLERARREALEADATRQNQ